MGPRKADVVVVGAGPAGATAAIRAADLNARVELVTSNSFGGMAANDGPVPVRVLSQAARLIREARQLDRYGVTVNTSTLDYSRLLMQVREVVGDMREHSAMRERLDAAGVILHEAAGAAHFVEPHTIETARGMTLQADAFILCTGGVSRRLRVPGAEFTSTHSDAWALTAVPPSMLVVGAGDTGLQVASIFNAFGSKVHVFEQRPRVLPHADDDIAAAVTAAFRDAGMAVKENFGAVESFEKTADGVRMTFVKGGERDSAEATLAVVAAGWVPDTAGLNLAAAGVELTERGFVKVDEYLRTSAPHIFAAGDVTGRLMLVPEAVHDGFLAATNAVRGSVMALRERVSPTGSFTDPEYASIGLTERAARQTRDVVTALVRFDSTARTIIDGRTAGFCKLIVDRQTARILGCHVVGERAVDIVQVATIAVAAEMRVDAFARIPLSFPTYAGILSNAAASAARQLRLEVAWE
jgi:pyruvate/2-oxoglutarate dehydrogenase complex dihydrolipoamide dehydrogenase (E3) component